MEQQQFMNWANAQSRDVSNDKYDYDIQGWWKNNPNVNLNGSHLTDNFKKPNHPTFSNQSQYHGIDGNEGGSWDKRSNGSWNFTPGNTNLQHYTHDELNGYFNRVEKGNTLELPPIEGARKAPDGHWYVPHGEDGFARVEV